MSSETAAMCRELGASAAHFAACQSHAATLDVIGVLLCVLGVLAFLAIPVYVLARAAKEPAQRGFWPTEEPRPEESSLFHRRRGGWDQ